MPKRVIELIRVSTESQAADDRASVPAQRHINRRTASAYGLEIVRSIEISDVSGAAVLRAPEVQLLLQLIESPDIHGVVTREFSRLMRPENFSDYALLQAFSDTNTILYLPDGPLDFTSKTGRLLGTIRAAIAGMERSEILERVWSAKEEQRKAGKFPQSKICLPFGVTYDKVKGWSYLPESARVREAFRLVLSGDTSYWSIGRIVGIEPTNLRVILRNPIYTGWRIIDKRRDPSPGARRSTREGRQADRPKIKRSEEDTIRVRVIEEPLISEADFGRVQTILNVKRAKHWRSRGDAYEHRFTYNGFLTCSACGKVVHAKFRAHGLLRLPGPQP
ncbi:MAG: recombinase family protein [Pyrinomonadaceae bacterium]